MSTGQDGFERHTPRLLICRALEEAIVDIVVVNHPKEAIPWEENYELLLKVCEYDHTLQPPSHRCVAHTYSTSAQQKWSCMSLLVKS